MQASDTNRKCRGTTILEVSNLRLQRGKTLILTDVHWRVRRGEHWVILGANGSGKTSLLSVLTGISRPRRAKFSCWAGAMADSIGVCCAKKSGSLAHRFVN